MEKPNYNPLIYIYIYFQKEQYHSYILYKSNNQVNPSRPTSLVTQDLQRVDPRVWLENYTRDKF
jgi:hypothetical protein